MVGSVSGLDRITSLTGTASWSGLVGVGTLCKLFAVTVVLTLALASAALADQVTNRIDDTSDTNLENVALNEGGTQTVAFRVHVQGNDLDNGCNIDPGEQLTVQVISSATSVATVNPQTLTFTDCNQNMSVTLTALNRGTSTITVAQAPGLGSNTTGLGTYDYTPASFTVTVNSAPTISDIADQSTDEDTPTADIPFTIGDFETAAGDLTLSASSSNTALIPEASITFGGSGANRTVTLTPAANHSGTATITVAVSDGAATTSDTFVLSVNPLNDAPTISDIADKTVEQDTNSGPIPFIVGDVESPAGELTLSGSSSDQALVPDANIVFGGSGENRTLTVTPAAGKTGTATITVAVSDENLQATDTFVITVQDTIAPTLTNVGPTGKKVSRKTMVGATFSEAMNEASVEALGTFTLKKGTKTVGATVDYDPATRVATLDPAKKLRSGAVYTVNMLGGANGAKDQAGNALDQDPNTAGIQSMIWSFKVRR